MRMTQRIKRSVAARQSVEEAVEAVDERLQQASQKARLLVGVRDHGP